MGSCIDIAVSPQTVHSEDRFEGMNESRLPCIVMKIVLHCKYPLSRRRTSRDRLLRGAVAAVYTHLSFWYLDAGEHETRIYIELYLYKAVLIHSAIMFQECIAYLITDTTLISCDFPSRPISRIRNSPNAL